MSKKEINALNRKLSTNYLIIDSKNKLLDDIKSTIEEISAILSTNPEIITKLNEVSHRIEFNLKLEYQLDLFKVHFEEVHPLFFEKLLVINQNLTNNNLKLAALIKMGFNHKEIAFISHLSTHSVKKSIHRLKIKLSVPHDLKLSVFINQIGID